MKPTHALKPTRAATLFLAFALHASATAGGASPPRTVLVEAEQFAQRGGWVVDPQFMDVMGSPYLLAHGLGVPVTDAVTQVTLRAEFGVYPQPFWIPYRCLYSRNVANLFMAGRDISVTHEALGAVRVMRTGGCMGEVVGMAASLCRKHRTEPRAIYERHLLELQELMRRGAGKISGADLPYLNEGEPARRNNR
jgi:hypothetical protein